MKKGARPRQRAAEYLLANPHASNETVAQATGASIRTVNTARQTLVARGMIQRSYFDRQPRVGEAPLNVYEDPPATPTGPVGEAPVAPVETESTRKLRELEARLSRDLGEPLTPDDMRRRFAGIARWAQTTGEYALEIQAIQAHARLDAQLGARDRLGPGPPLTREAKVVRLSPLMEACGASIVAESIMRAFERPALDRLIDEIGRFMARKASDGQQTEENPSETSDDSRADAGSGPLPGSFAEAEGPGSGDADPTGESGATDSGNTDA